MELCGGTHTRMTGDVGLFKIIGDSSVASGVRRIEALTGSGTFQRLEEDEDLLKSLSHTLRTPRQELSRVVNRMLDQQRQLENELEALKLKSARSGIDGIIASQKTIDGTTVISSQVNGVDPSVLRELAEQIGAKIVSGIVVLGVASNGKVALVGFVSKDLQKKFHAGNIIKKVAEIVGGSGGGRPDFAQAGGKDAEKIDQALQAVYNIVAGT
jgi:alanyl-tRNA synthetase